MGDMIRIGLMDYFKDKPYQYRLTAWQVMEEMQEQYPHAEFGWDGFMIFLFYRMNC
jgi:hypothetical protein